MPGYVTGLGEAEVTSAYFMGDELGDGDNIILGIDFPDGTAMTAMRMPASTVGLSPC